MGWGGVGKCIAMVPTGHLGATQLPGKNLPWDVLLSAATSTLQTLLDPYFAESEIRQVVFQISNKEG